MDAEKELLIKKLYEKGTKLEEIKKIAKCSSDSINKIRDKYNLPKRGRNFITEPLNEEKVIKMYLEGIKSSNICKECKCSTNTITRVLKSRNIPLRTANRIPKSKDFSKFYDLSSSETQYWIGFICADGNIEYRTKDRTYVVSLFSKDQEIIDNYLKYLGDNVASLYTNPNGVIRAYISSKKLCEYFINELNIVPNKSNILNPKIDYTVPFILGYFDGDGCIVNSTEKRIRYECNITSGSLIFLEKIKEVLDNAGIHSVIKQHTDCAAYKINIDRKEESRKFYKFLYKNHVPCLSRKLNNFAALFGNIEEEKSEELLEHKENQQPNSLNSIKVEEEVQRLTTEELNQ